MRSIVLAACVLFTSLTACVSDSTTPKLGHPLPTLVSIDFPYAKVRSYDISGSTESEIDAQLSTYGPYGHDAYTQWSVRWDWPGRGTTRCRLQQVQASYEITVTFPRWVPPAAASPELVAKWNAYLYTLALHEKAHINNVVKRFPAVSAAIKGSTCSSAEDAAQAVVQQMRQFDSEYDTSTDHGLAEGVHFP